MPYTSDQLMRIAVECGSGVQKPKDVEVILIFFDPASHCIGWASTITGPDTLSVISDVLDEVICQDGGEPGRV